MLRSRRRISASAPVLGHYYDPSKPSLLHSSWTSIGTAVSTAAQAPAGDTANAATDGEPVSTVEQLEAHAAHAQPSNNNKPAGSGCEASGYCSLGKVSPWKGDLWPSDNLKAAIKARSFKNELIIIGESRVNPFLQAYLEFRHLGMGHILWVTNRPEKCERAEAIFPGELGCGWADMKGTLVPKDSGIQEMHLLRVAILARAARIVNVLLIDTDILMFQDPYTYLKQPPLKDVNYLIMRDGDGFTNCGVVYLQNAAPNGPSAYAIGDVVSRWVRWSDDNSALISKTPSADPVCWEQSMYSDTLLSARAGRPVFLNCWMPGRNRDVFMLPHQKLFNTTHNLGLAPYLDQLHFNKTGVVAETARALDMGRDDYVLLAGNTSVPHFRGVWPEELGGAPYGAPGRFFEEWMSQLKADVLPVWAQPDVAEEEAAADAAPHETVGFFPPWFVESWSNAGWKGTWSPWLLRASIEAPLSPSPLSEFPRADFSGEGGGWGAQPAPSVMAHFVHVPGGASNKLTVRMVMGHYNWSVAHPAKAGVGAFFASTHAHQVPGRVVGYDPTLWRTLWETEDLFRTAVQALVRVALLTNRTAVLPPVPAEAPWVVKDFRAKHYRQQLPLVFDHGKFICYGDWTDVRCLWGGYLPFECLKRPHPSSGMEHLWAGALLPIEYEHWVTLLPAAEPPTVLELPPGLAAQANNSGAGSIPTVPVPIDEVVRLLAAAPRASLLRHVLLPTTATGAPTGGRVMDALPAGTDSLLAAWLMQRCWE